MTIYRYGGWLAWTWRVLAGLGIAASGLLGVAAFHFHDWTFLAMAAPIALPALLLPAVVAVRIDRAADDVVVVTTLGFVRRRIPRASLGRPRVRLTAQAAVSHIAAPRAWIPVARSWPIYVDLFADIPDPTAFRSTLGLPGPRDPA